MSVPGIPTIFRYLSNREGKTALDSLMGICNETRRFGDTAVWRKQLTMESNDSGSFLCRLLKHLSKHLFGASYGNYLQMFDWPCFYTALKHKSAIESLEVGGYAGYGQAEREILEYVQMTKVLQTLSFFDFIRTENITWRSIFRSLRENNGLRRRLCLDSKILGDDDAYWEFMAMMQVNSTLQEIMFYGYEGARAAIVREDLRCKARQESYLVELQKSLGQGQAKWQSSRC